MSAAPPLLRARGLRKRHADGGGGGRLVLDQVDLELAAGEHVALTGASGSGKSTLLQILGALDDAYGGDVWLDGTHLGGLADAARATLRCHTLGFVFQAHNLLPHLTVAENVALPARFAGPGAAAPADVATLLAQVGLGGCGARRPAALSGGERQRVALARALVMRPKLVLADEPTGSLDAATGAAVVALLATLRDAGVALLLVTHDPAVAAAAQRVLRLADGRLQ